jgi:peptide/nickel transport system substrate-binding protein
MKKWYGLIIPLILLCTLLVVACSSSPTTSTPAATSSRPTTSAPTTSASSPTSPATPTATSTAPPTATQSKYGGVFREIESRGPTNVGDPAVVPSIPTYYRPAGESLFYLKPDATRVPRLATSWDFDPNGKYVTFHLRQGVKFQDGTDFNAEAVKFCLDRGINGQAPGLKPITSVEVLDNYTVKVNWASFDYSVWDSLGGQKGPSWIVSPTSIQSHDEQWPLLNIVGTGPFKFIDYQRDVSLNYERFDGYWQEGLPYLDGVEFLLVADLTTGVMAFKSGAAEMIPNLTPSNAIDLENSGFNVEAVPGWSMYFAFSSANPNSPFSDLRVRQAATYAVDTAAIAKGIGQGYYLPSNQPFPSSSWANNPDIQGYPYNPEKAKQLLAEAGYPSGFKTEIYLQQGPAPDMEVAVQAYLKAVGIDAEIRPLSAPAIADMTSNSGWEGLMSGRLITLIGGDPGASMQGMGFINRGTYYTSVMRTEDTQSLLNQANAELDQKKRAELLQEMNKLAIDKYAMILPVYYTQNLIGVQSYVQDIGVDQFAYTYDLAWLSK